MREVYKNFDQFRQELLDGNISGITDAKKRNLYKNMWGQDCTFRPGIDVEIEQSRYHGRRSVNSYSFNGSYDSDENGRLLADIFGLDDKRQFEDKYEEAVNGSGQEGRGSKNDTAKILAMHSSSLCALLHFYNIENNNLTVENMPCGAVTFTESLYEYQSPVTDQGGPSNMDVVLLGKTSNGKPVVLFLESKFAEYYLYAGSIRVRSEYKKTEFARAFYCKDGLLTSGNIDLAVGDDVTVRDKRTGREHEEFSLKSKNPAFYVEGIKQMISHYTGIMNLTTGRKAYLYTDEQKYHIVQEYIENGARVYLGEIIFRFDFDDAGKAFEAYLRAYRDLAAEMNQMSAGKVTVLPDLLDYRTVFAGYKLDSKIRDFYYNDCI